MKTVVIGLIEYGGKVLIGRKVAKPGHSLSGKWHIPGGKVDDGESVEAAVRREMLEETGLTFDTVNRVATNTVDDNFMIWFLCKPRSITSLKAGGDLDEVKFVTKAKAFEVLKRRALSAWPKEIVKFMRRG